MRVQTYLFAFPCHSGARPEHRAYPLLLVLNGQITHSSDRSTAIISSSNRSGSPARARGFAIRVIRPNRSRSELYRGWAVAQTCTSTHSPNCVCHCWRIGFGFGNRGIGPGATWPLYTQLRTLCRRLAPAVLNEHPIVISRDHRCRSRNPHILWLAGSSRLFMSLNSLRPSPRNCCRHGPG